jgi:hypothetical protein
VLQIISILYWKLYKNYNNLNNLNFKEFKLIGSKKIVMVIDGTEQKVSCPQNLGLSKAIYSGKKSVHSFTKLVGISPITNKIIYITKSYGGSHSDQQLFNIKENNLDKILEEDEFIAGDLGFSGKCFLTKFKHPKNKSQENFNIDFQSTRIKIENIFAFLKKNEILNLKFRIKFKNTELELKKHHKIFYCLSGIYNQFFNIRSDLI